MAGERLHLIDVAEAVARALEAGQPVVALETAVSTHGLPYPRNLEAVRAMEQAIREQGAIPATCLVSSGRLVIGAPEEQIRDVATNPSRQKASVRDLGLVLATGTPAGLTVSATLYAAQLAGIQVFATGGIGGVHVGGHDVSADLHQLVRSPVITICSGAKSVLDIPLTLEYLETLGVPVFSYQSDHFPAFYMRSSGIRTPRVETPAAIARVARFQWQLGSSAGLVVGNPIPESAAIPPALWTTWLESAQRAATNAAVRGGQVTPYLLDRVSQESRGQTVDANLSLLRSNASLAAEVARGIVS